jgi:hypothetical protein
MLPQPPALVLIDKSSGNIDLSDAASRAALGNSAYQPRYVQAR